MHSHRGEGKKLRGKSFEHSFVPHCARLFICSSLLFGLLLEAIYAPRFKAFFAFVRGKCALIDKKLELAVLQVFDAFGNGNRIDGSWGLLETSVSRW